MKMVGERHVMPVAKTAHHTRSPTTLLEEMITIPEPWEVRRCHFCGAKKNEPHQFWCPYQTKDPSPDGGEPPDEPPWSPPPVGPWVPK